MTPLGYAALMGHAEIVKVLIEHGANVEAVDTVSKISLYAAVS